MKLIWNVVAVLCFLNVVALLAFFGWLANSGRLNRARVQEVTSIFSESVQAEQAAATKAAQSVKAAGEGEPTMPDGPPVSAEDQLTLRVMQNAADQQRIQRLNREVADLRATLKREREMIDAERSKLAQEQASFNAMRNEIASTEGAEQFRKALNTLETVQPKAAMSMLLEMIRSGNRDEAVGYLNAMQDRNRTKIVAELVKATETALAAELLEELRVRGVGGAPPGAPPS